MLYQSKCQKILQQIIIIAKPLKVLLFGSAARQSLQVQDLDFLIVVPDEVDCRKTARDLYRLVHRGGIATDFVVVTASQIDSNLVDEWSVISSALKEGVILYDAANT